MRTKNLLFLIVLFLFLASCNLPNASETQAVESPAAPGVDVVATAVELTTTAKMTELAAGSSAAAATTEAPPSAPTETPGFTPTPSSTPCTPLITANTVANIRSGPGTVYDIVGSLGQGQSATMAGRNDANTWWYIEFSGATGGYAWISGTVVTTACVPTSLQIVAAPPTPEPTATEKVSLPPPVAGLPDLVANGMQFSPDPGKKNETISIQVRVTNNGGAPAGSFTVVWEKNQNEVGCSWDVQGLGVGKSKSLSCTTTYTNNPGSTSSYYVALEVDSGNQVAESDEGNNEQSAKLKVEPQ